MKLPPPPTKVIAICRAIFEPKQFRGGVRDRLLNDLFKLHLQAEVIHQEGHKVKAYLIVLSEEIRENLLKFVTKYNLEGFVRVLFVAPPKVRSLTSPLSRNLGFLLEAEKAILAEANQKDVVVPHKNAVVKHSITIARKKARQAISSHLRNRQFTEGPISTSRQFIRLTLSGQITTLPSVENSTKRKKSAARSS